MTIIEAMKKVKANKEKVIALQKKIGETSAHYLHENPPYGEGTAQEISGWIKTCEDLNQESARLLVCISRTNLATEVTMEISGRTITKTIAEWIWRRREFAAVDQRTWEMLTDRGLREGLATLPGGINQELKIVRNYVPKVRDENVAMYSGEPFEIDGKLEVVNATTTLLEA